jgi:hypothetical protein
MGHWSPFEHIGKAMFKSDALKDAIDIHGNKVKIVDYRSGNLEGFVQYRKTFQGERKVDPRIIKK